MSSLPPVLDLIPHDPPMALLTAIVESGDDHAVTTVKITPESTFFESGSVPAIVSIEYMAQTIAAYAGALNHAKGEPIQLGFLMGCRTMTLKTDAFAAGDELRVEVKRVWSSDKLGQFECAVTREGAVVAEATLSVYQGRLEEAGIE